MSSLQFVSKIIEKHVDDQMAVYDDENNLSESFQSVYTHFYSTETAFLRAQNYLLIAIDTKCAALLIPLNVSAAFDMIDHQILLDRLEKTFGLKDEALLWMKSYLTEWTQCVLANEALSSPKLLEFGLPGMLDAKGLRMSKDIQHPLD